MRITRSWLESQSSRIPRDTGRFKGGLVRLIETRGGGLAPNAQVVEQTPGWVLATHFHREYQFQLFVSGWGTLGRHEARPLMLHYTSPESGYGPITAGPQGLAYYTLRPSAPAGACYLSEARETMQQGLAKRHAMSQRIAIGAQLPAVAQAADIETCIALDDGGMGAWKVSIAPGGTFAVSQLPGAGARYYYVASGGIGADVRMPGGRVHLVYPRRAEAHLACGGCGSRGDRNAVPLRCDRCSVAALPALTVLSLSSSPDLV